ncbi:hypothetical protein ACLLFA_003141, partial [Listeria monocytogenes]
GVPINTLISLDNRKLQRNKIRSSNYKFHLFKNYYFEFLKRAFMSTTIIKAKNKATTPTTTKEV